MALSNAITGDAPEDSSAGNFRRSMTFKAEEHEDSIGRSLSLVSRKTRTFTRSQSKDNSESYGDAYGIHLPQKGKKMGMKEISKLEIKQYKFSTDLPDRIIRQSLAVFDEFDADHNGFIEKKELRDTLNTMGIAVNEAQLERLVRAFDEDQDSKISKVEFLKMVKKIGLYHQRDDNNKESENVMCAFVALGGNSDFSGTVSCAKLRDMVNAFDLDLDVDALLALLDDDANGFVDHAEFSALFGTPKTQRSIVQEMINVIQEDAEDLHM